MRLIIVNIAEDGSSAKQFWGELEADANNVQAVTEYGRNLLASDLKSSAHAKLFREGGLFMLAEAVRLGLSATPSPLDRSAIRPCSVRFYRVKPAANFTVVPATP